VSTTAQPRLREFQNQGIEDLILVVEIKHDDDDSEETRAKQTYGASHFGAVNQRLRHTNPINLAPEFRESVNQVYAFTLLRPNEYPGWFSRLRTGLIIFDVRDSSDEDEIPINESGETSQEVIDRIRSIVQEDWGENLLPFELMEALLSKMNRDRAEVRIPFAAIAELVGHEVPDRQSEEAALYLASNRVGMLNLVFEWRYDDGSADRIPLEIVYRSLQTGAMANPSTGITDPEFKSKIRMFFETNTQLGK
jgi:hypothetical protein